MKDSVKYDKSTSKWFESHIGAQTTVCQCDKCGLFYKPSLGHKCNRNGVTRENITITHPNGYSAVLYGESSMCVYNGRRKVLHTGSRNVNTEAEVMEMLGEMPEFLQKIMEVK